MAPGRAIAKGAALVFANDDNKACYDILLAKETQARQVNAGLWARKLGVKDKKEDENEKGETNQIKLERNQKSTTFFFMADDLAHLNRHPQGEFVITRGKVVGIGHSGLNSFINFSRNWKEDFTILIEKRHFRQKSKTWPELETLTGKTIEVRGWLDHWNGPMIRLDIPEMLRLVDQEKENE